MNFDTTNDQAWVDASHCLQWLLGRFVESLPEAREAGLWLTGPVPAACVGQSRLMPGSAPGQLTLISPQDPSPWASCLNPGITDRGVVAPLSWNGVTGGVVFIGGAGGLEIQAVDLAPLAAASAAILSMDPRPGGAVATGLDGEAAFALGKLAAGVAPELNSLLTEVLGQAQILTTGPSSQDAVRSAKTLLSSARRARALTQPLASFGRPQSSFYEQVSLQDLLDQSLTLVRNIMAQSRIRVEAEIQELPDVSGDPRQLLEVLVNLLLNSQQAIGSLGVIRLSAKAAGGLVEVTLGDFKNGPGTSGSRPAFGLESAGRVIREHGGEFVVNPGDVESPVVLRIPTAGAPSRPSRGQAGEDCILVLDRDPEQREMITSVLHTMGQREVVACHPGNARDLTSYRRVSLAVLDAFPEDGVPTLYSTLRARRSTLPIIFAVHRNEMELSASLADPWSFLLNKPFRRRDLATLVARLLDLQNHSAA